MALEFIEIVPGVPVLVDVIPGFGNAQAVKIVTGGDGVAAEVANNIGDPDAATLRVASANITKKAADATFNRPANATPITNGDAIANNAAAGSVVPLQWAMSSPGWLSYIRIKKSDQTVATPTIRLWLFDALPTPGAGDNAAFVFPAANSIGYVDVDVTNAGSDDAVGFKNCNIPFTVGTIYGLLQSKSDYVPGNTETYTVTAWWVQG